MRPEADTLITEDDGIGRTEEGESNGTQSLGINLIHSYVAGLSGEIEANFDNGTCYTITFSEYEECQATEL